jgi:transcriptional regulator with XRE-family HTH domain
VEKNDKKTRILIFDKEGLMLLAKRLKELRSEKMMSQEELADKSEITLSQIARIETAIINPTVSTMFKIARGLDVSPKELFDFELTKTSK